MLAKEGMAILPLLLLMLRLLLLILRLLLLMFMLLLMLPFRMFSKFCDLGTALKKLWMSCKRNTQ
jgi:hypothetical protein